MESERGWHIHMHRILWESFDQLRELVTGLKKGQCSAQAP
jgi:hypothetical protein